MRPITVKRVVNAVIHRLPSHAPNRLEEWLLGLRDFERLRVPEEPALTIICDDGATSDLGVLEVLDKHRVKGVFAVSPDLIGRPGFLSYEELRSVRAGGHEIAFHGTTHDPFTGFTSARELEQAIRQGIARLEDEALGRPTTLVYPYGRHSRMVRKAVRPWFDCAFTTWNGLNRRSANRYAIRRMPFGAYVGKLPGTENWYREIIDRCKEGACWPALMLHPGSEGHTDQHNEMLSRLLDYARERKVPVRTAAQHVVTLTARG